MKHFLYFIGFIVFGQLQAQHITQKFFSTESISTININGNSVFKITVETTKDANISMSSRVEGEHNEHIILVTETKDSVLYVSTKYQPLFDKANDKLSAHKMSSIEFIITVPKHFNVQVNSDITDVIVKGQYKYVAINLKSGHCTLHHFSGQSRVNTIEGNIVANINYAQVEAITKHGIIKKQNLDPGKTSLLLESINGNITVNKSQ